MNAAAITEAVPCPSGRTRLSLRSTALPLYTRFPIINDHNQSLFFLKWQSDFSQGARQHLG